ncbi:hypothetical protein CLPU_3c02740 [Gottschalkia purinilytica]|uniref:Uncharacterized protein n=1 Tax=Gottschalkia purinilytica TaxID=1503 RepID=A0A0L0WDE1_GOTPU|nr:hypothetical protein [Gottschalkia purinilytica]KNF09494.1 hypothetical protein CLPU_3c02740 [Gottschalkia purinilytica]
MNLICPLCNGLKEKKVKCKNCSDYMKDYGPIVNFYDDYSPYLSNDITQLVDGVSHDCCLHLFNCDNCNYDEKVKINRVRK